LTILPFGLLAAVSFSSCASVTEAGVELGAASGDAAPQAKKTSNKMQTGATPPTTDLVAMRDPVEDMFSIALPKGWANRVYSVRVYDYATMVFTSISPDGSVVLFMGDPSMPQHFKPSNDPIAQQIARWNKMARVEPFVPAEEYFPAYAKRKFGKLPGFKITNVATDETEQAKLQQKFDERGMPAHATVAKVDFSYGDGEKTRHVRILGTSIDGPNLWSTSVAGVASTGDPNRYTSMMEAMGNSYKMNPAWQARQQERHQQAMAEIRRRSEMEMQRMTSQHNANMAWIQDSAERHQQRMQALWSANDAHNQAFEQRMSSMDTTQRSFLNYINDENTVVSSNGKTYQVDNSYQRYFMNKTNHTYVGGDIGMDLDKLRQLGLNPDDYEEVKVRP
jgi:hypothetical protein